MSHIMENRASVRNLLYKNDSFDKVASTKMACPLTKNQD